MISVVIPAYNVEQYIGKAIDSILAQTYSDWELIIVDDCSCDRTVSIVDSYILRSSKIKLIRRSNNSGGARLPRFDGILAASGEYITHIDADDFVEEAFLEKLLRRMEETHSTIVLSKLRYCNDVGVTDGRQIPDKNFDFSVTITGEEACISTINGWQLNLAGLLTTTTFYQAFVKKYYNDDCRSCFNDELDYRKLLFSSQSVSFSDATYYYRQHAQSVVHLDSSQYIDRINQIIPLYEFIATHFNGNSKVLVQIQQEYLQALYIAESVYVATKRNISKSERSVIGKRLREAYRFMKINHFKSPKIKYSLMLKSRGIMSLIVRVRQAYLKLK